MTLVLTILAICAVISALRCQRETECSNALVGWARNRVLRVVVIGHYWEQTENMKIRLTKSQDHEEVETLEIARV